jgi:thiosulfate/3-mercaptopyruvate sulfurtransferase
VVDAAFLAEHPHAVLADVRWYLDGRDGHAAFEAGHLPGAVWVDLDHDLAADPAADGLAPTAGRHPFPTPERFAAAMGRLGIGDDSLVVAYDDTGGLTAGRLVVMLRMLGRDAALLDGGLTVWATAHPDSLQQGAGRVPEPAVFTPRPWPEHRLAGADDVARAVADGAAVLDARARERFTGEVTAIDPRPGHIPGARSAPWSDVLGPDARMRGADELRAHYAALGVHDGADAVAYCGSGVSACLNVLGLEQAGFDPPRLYVASWSGWSADPAREAELGG